MKKFLFGTLVLNAFIAVGAMAAETALVTKSNHTGFTAPEWSRFEQCEVFKDRATITKRMGSGEGQIVVSETRKLKIDGKLAALVAKVATEEITEKENMLCDGPATVIVSGDNILFTTGGCGSPRKERQGNASRMLRELVDAYCPTTHDVGAN